MYLFDLEREEPLNMAENEEEIVHMFSYYDYVNIWSFKGQQLSKKVSEPLMKQWNRVMEGLPAEPSGGYHNKPLPQRSLNRKDKRNDSERIQTGSIGKRSSTSTESFKKKRLSGDKLARPLGPNVPAKLVKEIRTDRTKSARAKKQISTQSQGSAKTSYDIISLKRIRASDQPSKDV